MISLKAMNIKKNKSYFQFSKEQQRGILGLFLIIIAIQVVSFFVDFKTTPKVNLEEQKWLALNSEINALENQQNHQLVKMYPFNPNFINDYKGYKLGMSVAELDKLQVFRKQNKYVNSAEEFQVVTGVSDSLLAVLSPYFKFPDWVKNKTTSKPVAFSNKNPAYFSKKEKLVVKDINQATQEDLKKVYGIGDGLSVRILKEKEKFGGFVSMDQMNDVWGLSPEVIAELTKSFSVKSVPEVKKIHINDASLKELMAFPYFRYALAKSIITYRSMNGKIANAEDLTKISGFPVEKINIIALYLEF